MPARRKNLDQLRASGTYQQNRRRYAGRNDTTAAVAPGRPVKPDGLSPAESNTWDNLCDHLEDMGVLSEQYGYMLHALVKEWHLYLRVVQDDEISATARDKALSRFVKLAREFGLSPSSANFAARTAPKPEDTPEWKQFEDILVTRRSGIASEEFIR